MGDLFSSKPLVRGTWVTLGAGHRLVYLGGERVLDWVPENGGYRIWRYDRDVTESDPLPDLTVEGMWHSIRTGHELVYLGGDRVLDWVPEDGSHRIWRYDRNVTEGDPLPDLVVEGVWHTIRTGHRLVYLDGDRVLDWVPENGGYRIWRYDRNVTAGDPLPDLIVEGTWHSIHTGHEIIYLDGDRVLDWVPEDGSYRLWRYDRAKAAADPLPDLLAKGQWDTIRTGHQLIYLGSGRILDWQPTSGDYRLWPLRGVGQTHYVDGAHQGAELGTAVQPFRAIGAALARAVQGDTVLVASGVYRENVRLKAGVCLMSPATGAAIIHGGAERGGGHPAVTGADNAELCGFTVCGGYDGIHCDGTSPTIRRNVVRSNYGDGGIVCLNGSRAIVENNTILGNLGNATNGLAVGLYAEGAIPTVRNNIITGNDIGYAPYLCSPLESYNDIWRNRRNFGYNAHPGTGTISLDPQFTEPSLDDYRLDPNSPCRDAGDPDPACNDANGSRNDMGAFDGDGGWAMPLPVQEYFLESVLDAREDRTGLLTNGTSRFTADPIFWFPPAQRGQGEQDARAAISTAIRQLTGGRYQAVFRTDPQPPANRCSVVEVLVTGKPQGWPHYQGLPSPLCRGDTTTYQTLAEQGAPIIGGELVLGASLAGLRHEDYETLRHELGHVASLQHAFSGEHVMGQGGGLYDYSPSELAASELLFQYPPGTRLERFLAVGKIHRAALDPFPRLDCLLRWDGQDWIDGRDAQTGEYWARPGNYLLLRGSRLTLRFKTEYRWSYRPAGYQPPVACFGDLSVVADVSEQFQRQTAPANTWAGAPARNLKIQVPAGAQSGWLYVRTRDLESRPLWLEIR